MNQWPGIAPTSTSQVRQSVHILRIHFRCSLTTDMFTRFRSAIKLHVQSAVPSCFLHPLHPRSPCCFNSQSLLKLSFASSQQPLVIQATYSTTMHTSTFLSLVVAASLAVAAPQATSLNDLPVCAQQAGLAAIDATGCSLGDISCICNSVPFISTLRSYIEAQCSASDQAGKRRASLTLPPHNKHHTH